MYFIYNFNNNQWNYIKDLVGRNATSHSHKNQKLSWFDAYNFCSQMNLNATLLVLTNINQFGYLTETVRNINRNDLAKYIEDPTGYNIGFHFTQGISFSL